MFKAYETQTAPQIKVSIPPPRLPWGLVLLFGIFTGWVFLWFWLIILSNWSRRVRGKSIAFPLSIANFAWPFIHLYVLVTSGVLHHDRFFGYEIDGNLSFLLFFVFLLSPILFQVASSCVLRYEFDNEPIAIPASMGFSVLFGPIYFQYLLNDHFAADKQALDAINRCDGCKTVFTNCYGLTKVEGKGYLCEKCRSEIS